MNLYFVAKKSERIAFLRELESISALLDSKKSKIARREIVVVAHVHFQEVWKEIKGSIENIDPDKLIITTTQGSDFSELVLSDFPNANILNLPNQGRDIWPLIILAQRGLFVNESIVFKIHTKKSKHLLNGNRWRKDLLQSISHSKTLVAAIKELLEFSSYSLVGTDKYLQNMNKSRIEANEEYQLWAMQNALTLETEEVKYIDGTIFACKSEVLAELAKLSLTEDDFLIESNDNNPFSKKFAMKMYLYEKLRFIPSLKQKRMNMDLATRPASSKTYAIEGYLGFLAKKHGKSSGVLMALKDYTETKTVI